ncbi:MAG: LysR family transcriptional regulator [Candidatus Accumulibacter sp.]|jgi:DNA-binding transcriptional LysR family regulator|nr:LysR family transcriptional regulator [Accumulibacter sp.]
MTEPPSRTNQLLNRLRMRQVALVLAIDEFRTLRAATERLGMTEPAGSVMLRELEDALGEPLFDRVGRGLTLNQAGQAVLHGFRDIRNSMAALERGLRELRLGSSGKLLVGTSPTPSYVNLSAAVIALKAEFPRLSLELNVDTSDRLLDLLRNGRLDLIFARRPQSAGDYADCIFTPIGEGTVSAVVACGHPLARTKKKRLAFAVLLDYPWIFELPGSPIREIIELEFRYHHTALPPAWAETSSFLTATDLVAHSQAIAVMSTVVARHFSRHGALRIVPYTFVHSPAPWGSLVHHGRYINPVMRRFLDLMQSKD